MSIARDIVDIFQAAGLGTEAVDLFEGTLPDSDSVPGSVMAVGVYFGRGAIYNFDAGAKVTSNYPRFQVLFRDQPDMADATLVRATAVFDWCEQHFGHIAPSGAYYPRIAPLQTPAKIGPNQSDGRSIFGFNIEATRNP